MFVYDIRLGLLTRKKIGSAQLYGLCYLYVLEGIIFSHELMSS